MLVWVKTLFIVCGFLFNFSLDLTDGFHLELEGLICDDWVVFKHFLKVLESGSLWLEGRLEHGLSEFHLLLSFKVDDLVLDVLWHFF